MELRQRVNRAYRPLFQKHGKRYVILMGGRGAGRSTAASQYAVALLNAVEYFRCAIMRYILGDVRDSIYREIIDRLEDAGIQGRVSVADNTMTIKLRRNSIHGKGFKKSSGDQKAKLKSLANFNVVIIEEATEIGEEDFQQLDDSLRTLLGDIVIILLLNPPPKDHWIIRRWFNLLPSGVKDFYIPELREECQADTLFIRTSYRDNIKNLSPASVRQYENYRLSKPDHYYANIEGLVPETVTGKIFNNWREIPEVPFGARLMARGVDFGWEKPAAGVDVYYYDGGYILDEIFYQAHLRNREMAEILKAQEHQKIVIADQAEPKSIAELQLEGVNVVPCVKGADSVEFGIKLMNDVPISYTRRSKNLKAEYGLYRWKTDKDGEIVEGITVGEDHALDGARYALTYVVPMQRRQDIGAQRPRVHRPPKPMPGR